MKIKFGWHKDKFNSKDYLHQYIPGKLDNEVILVPPSVRDQGNEGSCVGHGIGANLTVEAMKAKVFTEWFSPRDIYNGARYIEGTLKSDDGCYARDALDWCLKKGCLLEHFWPYVPQKDLTKSRPSKLDPEAAKYPLAAYYRVDNGTDGICSAIAQGFCVSIGTDWFDKWMNPKNGVLPTVKVSDSVAGGHETLLYGYNISKAIFYGMNSWGTSWGNKGFYTMPFQAFDVFKQNGGYDAHYVKVQWNIPTPPTPPPTPPTTTPIRLQKNISGVWVDVYNGTI